MCSIGPRTHVTCLFDTYIYIMIQSEVKTVNKTKKKNEAAEQLKVEDSANLPLSCSKLNWLDDE